MQDPLLNFFSLPKDVFEKKQNKIKTEAVPLLAQCNGAARSSEVFP